MSDRSPILGEAEQDQVAEAARRLHSEFSGVLSAETIERFMYDSLDKLLIRARLTQWVPLLAERFARQRLRALTRIEAADDPSRRPGVLFLCTHNAGRSQMAAGYLRKLAGDRVDVFSGGTEPAASINPAAVEAMREVGIDISQESPQPWTDEIVGAVDVIVTMGCGDACPVLPGKRYVDWELTDPAGRPVEEVRPIRDEIQRRVEGLLADLGVAMG